MSNEEYAQREAMLVMSEKDLTMQKFNELLKIYNFDPSEFTMTFRLNGKEHVFSGFNVNYVNKKIILW